MNVTALRADSLESIFEHSAAQSAQVLLLQETRLHDKAVGWVTRIAKQFGWRVSLSTPPPAGQHCKVRQGGTAIFWKPIAGITVTTHRAESHRVVALRSNLGTFVSCYGPAKFQTAKWMEEALAWVQQVAEGNDKFFVAGDLNLKESLRRGATRKCQSWGDAVWHHHGGDNTSESNCKGHCQRACWYTFVGRHPIPRAGCVGAGIRGQRGTSYEDEAYG